KIHINSHTLPHHPHLPNCPTRVAAPRPPPAAPGGGPGGGHGLVGMRERATMLGGRFSAGPATDGGFLVEAELPLTREGNSTSGHGSEAPPGRR
ncbi:hypothetical protein ABZ914_19810, partial [Spirillospora sp. NPDC046719]